MVKPELRTAITSHSTFALLKRYANLVETGRPISPIVLMSHKQHMVHVLISPYPSPFPQILRPTPKLRTKI